MKTAQRRNEVADVEQRFAHTHEHDLQPAHVFGTDAVAAFDLFEQVADGIDVFVPGHGSAGDAVEFRKRIEMDRAYLDSLGDGAGTDDPRITAPRPGWEWVSDFYSWQVQRFGPRHPHG